MVNVLPQIDIHIEWCLNKGDSRLVEFQIRTQTKRQITLSSVFI